MFRQSEIDSAYGLSTAYYLQAVNLFSGKIHNQLAFGRKLYQLMQTPEIVSLLPHGDWVREGAFVFARTLQAYIGKSAQLVQVASAGYQDCVHLAVRLDTPYDVELYLDADGIGTRWDLFQKLSFYYDVSRPQLVKFNDQQLRSSGFFLTEPIPGLNTALQKQLGPWHERYLQAR